MIKSYLKTALRTFSRNRGYTLINVLGLVVGIAFSCMLYMYVSHELSYDAFHKKSDRIYRVLTIDERDPAGTRTYGVTVPPMGPELRDHYPEVDEMVRLYRFVGQVVFEIDGQNFQERNWYTTDANFFKIFDFEFLYGDKQSALEKPYSLVLTESSAKKYFGKENAVGEVIEKTSFGPVTVTGVIRDIPANSHLQFDLLFSAVRTDDGWQRYLDDWTGFGSFTYVVLHEDGAIGPLRAKARHLAEGKFSSFDGGITVDFQHLGDIHLHSAGIEEGIETVHGQMSYIFIFSSMGILLLVLACMNYVNLATCRAMVRSREVGVRKVAGARRTQLIFQFLTESFLITILSALLAILVMDLAFPYFNQITGKDFDIGAENLKDYLPAVAGIALVIGIISGGYPAFYLASLKPASSLRGRQVSGQAHTGLRKVLVIFQFMITIVMIVSTLVVGQQLKFVQTKDIGFVKSGLMVIDINSGSVRSQFRAIKNEYARIPGVTDVAVSTRVPGEWKNIPELYVRTSTRQTADSVKTYFMGFDEDMLQTYRIHLKSGRNFSLSGTDDSTHILLNESAVQAFALEEPLGARISVGTGQGAVELTVIGVVKDFNFQSLHQRIAPIMIGAWNSPFGYVDYFTLKVTGDVEDVVGAASQVHARFDQRTPIEYHFLDQQLESYYVAEKRAGMIFRMGGSLSIFIACLGLLGLATYDIQRRTKELGVRKVLGASGWSLFLLLSSRFAKQVGFAFLIAAPLAWYMMHEWLMAFEYRISLHVGLFAVAGASALMVALATISYRTFRATRTNPVNALRQE